LVVSGARPLHGILEQVGLMRPLRLPERMSSKAVRLLDARDLAEAVV
jgi:hypothetical protein